MHLQRQPEGSCRTLINIRMQADIQTDALADFDKHLSGLTCSLMSVSLTPFHIYQHKAWLITWLTASRPLDAQGTLSHSTDSLPHTLTCRRACTVNTHTLQTLHMFTPETSPWLHTHTHKWPQLSEQILWWSQLELRRLHLCSSSIVIKQAAVQTAQKI